MADVFLSYKREDQKRVVALARAIEQFGYTVWWDNNLISGERWSKRIKRELDSAACVVVVWSEKCIDADSNYVSEWVENEADLAAAKGRLVPVMIDKDRMPWTHSKIQFTDLSEWNGASDAPGIQKLIEGIATHAGQRAQPVSDEFQAWRQIETSKNPAAYQEFSERFPNSRYVSVAQSRIEELKGQTESQPEPFPAPQQPVGHLRPVIKTTALATTLYVLAIMAVIGMSRIAEMLPYFYASQFTSENRAQDQSIIALLGTMISGLYVLISLAVDRKNINPIIVMMVVFAAWVALSAPNAFSYQPAFLQHAFAALLLSIVLPLGVSFLSARFGPRLSFTALLLFSFHLAPVLLILFMGSVGANAMPGLTILLSISMIIMMIVFFIYWMTFRVRDEDTPPIAVSDPQSQGLPWSMLGMSAGLAAISAVLGKLSNERFLTLMELGEVSVSEHGLHLILSFVIYCVIAIIALAANAKHTGILRWLAAALIVLPPAVILSPAWEIVGICYGLTHGAFMLVLHVAVSRAGPGRYFVTGALVMFAFGLTALITNGVMSFVNLSAMVPLMVFSVVTAIGACFAFGERANQPVK